jgi:hypothetical protein
LIDLAGDVLVKVAHALIVASCSMIGNSSQAQLDPWGLDHALASKPLLAFAVSYVP